MSADILKKLAFLANTLDDKGFEEEADAIDSILSHAQAENLHIKAEISTVKDLLSMCAEDDTEEQLALQARLSTLSNAVKLSSKNIANSKYEQKLDAMAQALDELKHDFFEHLHQEDRAKTVGDYEKAQFHKNEGAKLYKTIKQGEEDLKNAKEKDPTFEELEESDTMEAFDHYNSPYIHMDLDSLKIKKRDFADKKEEAQIKGNKRLVSLYRTKMEHIDMAYGATVPLAPPTKKTLELEKMRQDLYNKPSTETLKTSIPVELEDNE